MMMSSCCKVFFCSLVSLGASFVAGDTTCSGGQRPCAAAALGDVGLTTATGTDSRSGKNFQVSENIYGPFEAGFGEQQNNILGKLGCSNPSDGHIGGGLDTLTAEQMVAYQCNTVLPRVENDGADGYVSLLDECGGHTQDYHFHERMACLYSTADNSGHSTQVGKEAGEITSNEKLLYGKYENFVSASDNSLPELDTCGGHFGITPDSNGASVYHYHVQDAAPFTFGCYGPNADDSLVTFDQCQALYDECGDGDVETIVKKLADGTVISTTYDSWCPCFQKQIVDSVEYSCNVAGGCTIAIDAPDTTTTAPQQDTTTAAPQQDTTTEAPQQDTTTEAPQQDATTETPQQDTTTETVQQGTTTETPQQDTTTEMPQQNNNIETQQQNNDGAISAEGGNGGTATPTAAATDPSAISGSYSKFNRRRQNSATFVFAFAMVILAAFCIFPADHSASSVGSFVPFVAADTTCSGGQRPCAAAALGDVGLTTATGTDSRSGKNFQVNENIYGPFEAGFGQQQNNILGQLGCSNPSDGHLAGGLDTLTAEQMVAYQCNTALPRVENDGAEGYISLLDECGGHTQDYHFHERMACLYSTENDSGHSTQVGKEAGEITSNEKLLYGKYENYLNSSFSILPELDTCGGHFGITPDSNGASVYHYHVQDAAPFTFGCYGPNADDSLVTFDQCRALYDECDDGDVETILKKMSDGAVISTTYDPWCPCFQKQIVNFVEYSCNVAEGCTITITAPQNNDDVATPEESVNEENTATAISTTPNATSGSYSKFNRRRQNSATFVFAFAMVILAAFCIFPADHSASSVGSFVPFVAADTTCSGGQRPCAAAALGDVGLTTATGTDSRSGKNFQVNENIYGPFEAGFGQQQNNILGQLGCSNPSDGHLAGGLDTLTAEQMVAYQCNTALPRVENDGADGYISLLDECGGHTQDYHFHERMACLYSTENDSGHSTQVGKEAGEITSNEKLLYGRYENFVSTSDNSVPELDTCGGHFGITPDSNGASVYHYHVQDAAPFTFGCYGPNADDSLVTLDQCRALYDECGDGDVETIVKKMPDGTVISTTYDPWCPCFEKQTFEGVEYSCNVADGCTIAIGAPDNSASFASETLIWGSYLHYFKLSLAICICYALIFGCYF